MSRSKIQRPKQRNVERERAIWEEKKKSASHMAARLGSIGESGRSYRMGCCADTIISDVCRKCETRYIIQTHYCRDRLCPICSWRRSLRLAHRLSDIIAANEREKHSRYIFLTLTVRNVPWSELSNQVKTIMASWHRMNKRLKRAAVVIGWVRAFEVTMSKEDGTAHPHLHVLMQVGPEYFLPENTSPYVYHKKNDLIRQWKECLHADYDPSISIKAIREADYEIGRAVTETTKYISKGSSGVNRLSLDDFRHYAKAMKGVRAWGAGGRMRITEEEIDARLHGDEPAIESICGNCGDNLFEMREVWSSTQKAYTMKIEIDYNSMKSKTNHNTPIACERVVNFNINSGGGNIYVGRDVCG